MSWDIGFELNNHQFDNSSWNYTHNCNDMMREAGYDWVYHLGGQRIADTLPQFESMLEKLKADPARFKLMNPSNGWGDYDSLVDLWENSILPAARQIAQDIPEATWWEWS